MRRLEDRLRRLEEQLVLVPSIDEYLDASNREQIRALHELTERLALYGFDGGHVFTEADRRMLAEDTVQRRQRDRETVETWHRARGGDRTAVVEGARERLEAVLCDATEDR